MSATEIRLFGPPPETASPERKTYGSQPFQGRTVPGVEQSYHEFERASIPGPEEVFDYCQADSPKNARQRAIERAEKILGAQLEVGMLSKNAALDRAKQFNSTQKWPSRGREEAAPVHSRSAKGSFLGSPCQKPACGEVGREARRLFTPAETPVGASAHGSGKVKQALNDSNQRIIKQTSTVQEMNRISESVKAKMKNKYLTGTVSTWRKQGSKAQLSSSGTRQKSTGSAIKKYYNQVQDLREKSGSKIGSGVLTQSKQKAQTRNTLAASKSSFTLPSSSQILATSKQPSWSRFKNSRSTLDHSTEHATPHTTLSYMSQTKASAMRAVKPARVLSSSKKATLAAASSQSLLGLRHAGLHSAGRCTLKKISAAEAKYSAPFQCAPC